MIDLNKNQMLLNLSSFLKRNSKYFNIQSTKNIDNKPIITTSTGEDLFKTFEFTNDDELITNQDIDVFIKDCIKKLPKSQKEVLFLREYHKLNFKEISILLDIDFFSTISILNLALKNLHKILTCNLYKVKIQNYFPLNH